MRLHYHTIIGTIFKIVICFLSLTAHQSFAQPRSVDLDFNPGTGANSEILSVGLQSDGKLIIGGAFTTFNGTNRNRIARLNLDGSLDAAFGNGSAANGTVSNIYVLSDDRIIIAGDFGNFNGVTRFRLAKLNADGTLDTNFVASLDNTYNPFLAVQRDGKVIVSYSSSFVSFGVRRLTQAGAFDPSFDEFAVICAEGGSCNASKVTGGLQDNNRLIIGIDFFFRLHRHGSVDSSFLASNANKGVLAFAFQNDEKILVAGTFTNFAGAPRNRVARLHNDGTLDLGFNVGTGPNNGTNCLAIQPDGKILVAGSFTNFNGFTCNGIARLNADGSVDTNFDSGAGPNGKVNAVLPDRNGEIIIVGQFTSVNGVSRNRIARLNGDGALVPSFTVQPTNVSVSYGQKTLLTCNASISPPISYQWKFGGDDLLGETNQVLHFPDVKFTDAGDYSVAVSNGVEGIISTNATLSVSRALVQVGSLDAGFMSGDADGVVRSIAVKTNGKIVIGGLFTHVGNASRNFIAQLDSDGTLDADFNPGSGFNAPVYALAAQSNGKILAGGEFTNFSGVARSKIARLNPDGTLDTSFGLTNTTYSQRVNAVAAQNDGKVLIGFVNLSASVARITTNGFGFPDPNFTVNMSGDRIINSIMPQPDGKVLVAGSFIFSTGTPSVTYTNITRLQTNGAGDIFSFTTALPSSQEIFALALQPDGKILIGGYRVPFSGLIGVLARLNTNGTSDASFNIGTGPNKAVRAIAVQSDGKIIVAGDFLSFDNTPRRYIARLHPNGALDTSFSPPDRVDGTIFSTAVLENGKAVIGGNFAGANNSIRGGVARLNGEIQILNQSRTENGMNFSFLADPDKNYSMEYKETFAENIWTTITNLSGSNGIQTLADPNIAEAQRFYRLRAE